MIENLKFELEYLKFILNLYTSSKDNKKVENIKKEISSVQSKIARMQKTKELKHKKLPTSRKELC